MNIQSKIEQLGKYVDGNAAENEKELVYSLFVENENNPGFEEHLKKEFNEYFKNHKEDDFQLSHLLDRIHHTIHNDEYKKKQTPIRRIYKWYSVAAAIFLIPILIFGGLWFSRHELAEPIVAENYASYNVIAPLGARVNFTLPDGTSGWLNSGSSIQYHLPFQNNRNVSLTGEAWFHVTHDEEHPFEIFSGNSKVKVLGTKFNLNAYPDENFVEVVLEEGKVEFTAPGIVAPITMKPNEKIVYASDSIVISTIEAYKYSAWKEGKLIFRGDPMSEVAKRIERWYNVDVELVDDALKNYVIRGTFNDDSLEDVIKYLSMTSPIKYRIIDRKILNDSTYQQKKVQLFINKN